MSHVDPPPVEVETPPNLEDSPVDCFIMTHWKVAYFIGWVPLIWLQSFIFTQQPTPPPTCPPMTAYPPLFTEREGMG